LFACVANASNEGLTRFKHPHQSGRQRMVCAAQVANGVQVVAPRRVVLLPETPTLLPVRSDAPMVRKPTHSLPPGRRRTIWLGGLRRGYMKRVRRIERTLATNASRRAAAWSVRTFGDPQANT